MRTPRVIILLAFLLTFLMLAYLSIHGPVLENSITSRNNEAKTGVRNFFSFQTPLSLFPPNAVISLTDDNMTTFLARPAAFGPSLPAVGLSGQLWIGSGFIDDGPKLGMGFVGSEGELGCSDVEQAASKADTEWPSQPDVSFDNEQNNRLSGGATTSLSGSKASEAKAEKHKPVNDGTDDYLHRSSRNGPTMTGKNSDISSGHADIQSIQEGAEIAGKIVLLSRGGCGFLEKVKWVQRRGGVALIVGDDTRGGQLIQMYARGDTSNVTIPSIFTSWTTAHFLATMVGSGSYGAEIMEGASKNIADSPGSDKSRNIKSNIPNSSAKAPTTNSKPGKFRTWLSSLVTAADSSQPNSKYPTTHAWTDGKSSNAADARDVQKKPSKVNVVSPTNDDGFIIGVHDWRDHHAGSKDMTAEKNSGSKKDSAHLPPFSTVVSEDKKIKVNAEKTDQDSRPLLARLFKDDNEDLGNTFYTDSNLAKDSPHGGVWVTLTPTSAASPFFDTLLVLVVSPLITLTVVYALLLLRSRIRRRRWRAPKSVVERLPVRTYQTIAPSVVPSRIPSPSNSSASTPLLQRSQSSSLSRPRSRTTSIIPEPGNLSRNTSELFLSPGGPSHEQEKAVARASQWKKYMSKQVECVVCLEEYVDGVSRVMSLPCGHEFHVDCITPWLTTRRRTCPICKGDVVRSLARGGGSSPRYETYRDDDSSSIDTRDELQLDVASESLPITSNNGHRTGGDADVDLERGESSQSTSPATSSSWRALFGGSSAGSSSGSRNVNRGQRQAYVQRTQEDRNR